MFSRRQRRLRSALEIAKLSAGLLTDPNDVFYYTGYRPTAPAFLLVGRHRAVLFAFSVDNAAAALRSCETRFISKLAQLALPRGRVGFDQSTMTAQQYLLARKKGSLVPAAPVLAKPRQVKEPKELALMRQALKLSLRAHARTALQGSEQAIAAAFDARLRCAGAEPSFETIVASGRNSGSIHHHPTAQRARLPCVFDFGSRWQGYCSDTTRTCINPRDAKQRTLFATVQEMQGALIDFIQPGMRWKAVQDEWARLMKRAHKPVLHGFGHGIGLAVHEPLPELVVGSVLTVEPGIYGSIGCRIEDMVLITKRGARVLTR